MGRGAKGLSDRKSEAILGPSEVRKQMRLATIAFLLAPCVVGQPGRVSNVTAKPETIAVENGTVSFVVATNMPAIEVRGKSSALQARIELLRDAEGVTVERVEAWIPVRTLSTGMS